MTTCEKCKHWDKDNKDKYDYAKCAKWAELGLVVNLELGSGSVIESYETASYFGCIQGELK